MQDAHGVTSIGAKLRQEIRRSRMSYHERKHYFWKRLCLVSWCMLVGLATAWRFTG